MTKDDRIDELTQVCDVYLTTIETQAKITAQLESLVDKQKKYILVLQAKIKKLGKE